METIRGKTSLTMDRNELHAQLADYHRITLDLGTGDGKYAFHHAENFPSHFVIGIDSCRENLREFSRTRLPNLLYIIASAQSVPHELHGLISCATINFPWGSLLKSLLDGEKRFMNGLESVLVSGALLEVRLNGGALAESGWGLEEGAERVRQNLESAGWRLTQPVTMGPTALKHFHSTWARRIAFGRDPRAIQFSGCL